MTARRRHPASLVCRDGRCALRAVGPQARQFSCQREPSRRGLQLHNSGSSSSRISVQLPGSLSAIWRPHSRQCDRLNLRQRGTRRNQPSFIPRPEHRTGRAGRPARRVPPRTCDAAMISRRSAVKPGLLPLPCETARPRPAAHERRRSAARLPAIAVPFRDYRCCPSPLGRLSRPSSTVRRAGVVTVRRRSFPL
jgi:hypothetical protein